MPQDVPVFGPYDLESAAAAEPLPRATVRLYRTHGVGAAGDTVEEYLLDVLRSLGVELGVYDRRILVWIANRCEPVVAQVFLGLITRAYVAGRAAEGPPPPG